MAGAKLRVARSELKEFPQSCASCLSTVDLQYRTIKAPGSLFGGEAFQTSIPVCAGCMRRLRLLHPFGTSVLLVVVIWLGYRLDNLHVARPIAFLFMLLPVLHSYAVQALKGPIRVSAKRGNILEFGFTNHEYARLFELQNLCIGENSEVARMV
jgi:hypothetical protein